VRNPEKSKRELDELKYDTAKHALSLHQVDLSSLKEVRSFAKDAVKALGSDKLDYLLLNAAISKSNKGPGPHGSRWSESYVVSHLGACGSAAMHHQRLDAYPQPSTT
jgi:hypothetical protein